MARSLLLSNNYLAANPKQIHEGSGGRGEAGEGGGGKLGGGGGSWGGVIASNRLLIASVCSFPPLPQINVGLSAAQNM